MTRTRIVLVLVDANDDQRFVLSQSQGRLVCPQIDLTAAISASDTLGDTIEGAAKAQLSIDISYSGLIDFDVQAQVYEVVALGELRSSRDELSKLQLRAVSLEELRLGGHEAERLVFFEAAYKRRLAEKGAVSFGPRIHQAFEDSANYLRRTVANEGQFSGWSQFLDGQSVGLLSTAQGLAACVHAGQRGQIVDRAAQTIEMLQNSDGGWQVRRALVGLPSKISITESTCACLWALLESDRPVESTRVQDGVKWLCAMQTVEGAWPSSIATTKALTFPTALSVRLLSRVAMAQEAQKGAAWLQQAQNPDGGWGAQSRDARSHPAYTAHVIISLVAAGLEPMDPSIRRGCEYLVATANFASAEPWPSTSANFVVDTDNSSRLDYRHFSTPWVIAALCFAGRDLSDDTVLAGVAKLLDLRSADGGWTCSLTDPDVSTVWALHDSLYALRAVTTASSKHVAFLAARRYHENEKNLMQGALLRLLGRTVGQQEAPKKSWVLHLWLSVLTMTVLLIGAQAFGLLDGFASSSFSRRAWALVLTGMAVLAGSFGPPIVAQEYRFRRDRRESRRREP